MAKVSTESIPGRLVPFGPFERSHSSPKVWAGAVVFSSPAPIGALHFVVLELRMPWRGLLAPIRGKRFRFIDRRESPIGGSRQLESSPRCRQLGQLFQLGFDVVEPLFERFFRLVDDRWHPGIFHRPLGFFLLGFHPSFKDLIDQNENQFLDLLLL